MSVANAMNIVNVEDIPVITGILSKYWPVLSGGLSDVWDASYTPVLSAVLSGVENIGGVLTAYSGYGLPVCNMCRCDEVVCMDEIPYSGDVLSGVLTVPV